VVSSGKQSVGRFDCGRREEPASQPDSRIKEPVPPPAIPVSDRGNQPQGCPYYFGIESNLVIGTS
jgi:hypothetical protein